MIENKYDFYQQTQKIRTGKNGKWMTTLNNEPAGGSYTLTIKGKNTLAVNDVYVGEVWICSGQSNMEMPIAGWGTIPKFKSAGGAD